jgi:hypothetical protein
MTSPGRRTWDCRRSSCIAICLKSCKSRDCSAQLREYIAFESVSYYSIKVGFHMYRNSSHLRETID